MKQKNKIIKIPSTWFYSWVANGALICIGFLLPNAGYASIVDTDFYCKNYGCVVTTDNNTTDIYDVYCPACAGSSVPVGTQLIYRATNPSVGVGTVDPMYTGTNTNVATMLTGNGNRIRIINGLGVAIPLDTNDVNANGLLDAADTLTKFGIQNITRIDYYTPAAGVASTLGDNPQSHSYYISSRNVAFDIHGQSSLGVTNGAFPTNVKGSTIGMSSTVDITGTNAGVSYGTNTNVTITYVPVVGLTFQSLLTNPIVGSFTNLSIYGKSKQSLIEAESVRLNNIYTLPPFSLSQGDGDMNWTIGYTYWRR